MIKRSPTEGTWHVEDGRVTHPQYGTKDGGTGLRVMTNHAGPNSSFTVATVNPYAGGNEADAHVLAAAKDMAEALRLALPVLEAIAQDDSEALGAIAQEYGQPTEQERERAQLSGAMATAARAALIKADLLPAQED